MPDGTVTFLFTDIEGSTRRWVEDPTMAEDLSTHDEILRAAIEANRGHWVKHTGDGVLAVFNQASKAVEAATQIQRSLGDLEKIRVRIGLHSGEAERRGDDYFGLVVSAAARVMDAAHGGQVLISEATRAVLESSVQPEIELLDLGAHRLKDLGEPQHLYQVSAPGLEQDFPPIRTLDKVDHNLPVQLTSFVGREKELSELTDLISSHRLVTLVGVGGVGKTRLSLQAAAQMIDRFDDGIRFVELATVSDPDAVPVAVAAALGLRHEQGTPAGVVDRLVEHVRALDMLIVMDNCEHVIGSATSLISKILSNSNHVKVVASSREGLSIPGERIWQVPSLDLSSESGQSEASRLFVERASAVAPQLEWNEETQPHIDRICELLDGIPLATELAAAKTRVLSLEQISDRLEDRFRLLTGGSRSALPRQQTLEATVDWSYQLLAEAERSLFERLSVFVGGFTLGAAEAVCTDEVVDVVSVLELLTGLVDKSMVVAEQGEAGVSRYRLLETLRQYGLRRLLDSNQIQGWKSRHLAYFVGVLEEQGLLNWSSRDNLPWYVAEQGNLAAALDWARTESPGAVRFLATALSELHFYSLGDPEESLTLVEEALAGAEGDDRLALRLKGRRLRLLQPMGYLDEFKAEWQDLRTELDGVEDEDAVWCLVQAAFAFAWDPDLDASEAVPLAREAVGRSEDLDAKARYTVQMSLGSSLMWSNAHVDEIRPIFRAAAELAKEQNDSDRLQLALSLLLVPTMTADQREGTDFTSALEDELLEAWNESGRSVREEWIVWLAIRRGMWELAEEEMSQQEIELRGVRRWELLMPRAALRWMQGRYEEAEENLDAMAKHGQFRRWHHDYYPTRAEVAASRGDVDATQEWVRRHFEFTLKPAEEIMRIGTLRALVMAQVEAGDVEAATSTLDQIREISSQHPEPRIPVVQMGSDEFYLAASEAELTRVTGPDPGAWARAEEFAFWIYWTLYSRVRKLEAHAARGDDVSDEVARVRNEAETLGARSLVSILDSFEP